MRKLLLVSLLLAGAAATPALADPDHPERGDRAEHQTEHADRQAARVERMEMRSLQPNNGALVRQEHFQQNAPTVQQNVQPQAVPPVQQNVQPDRIERIRAERAADNADADNGVHRVRMHERQQVNIGQREGSDPGTLRQSDTNLPQVMQPHHRSPMVSDTPRPGTQPPLRVENHRWASSGHWNTNWRNDHRYDWRNWRNHHHSWFHLGFYYDPFGWGYQPYTIGWRMWPSYYSSNYWLNDPWEYRLPYAPAGTRWIRYYNDAILVDTFTGEVVDVIYNFFW